MFQVLDETPLQELIELWNGLKMHILEYNGKYYLKVNAVKLQEVKVENGFKKDHPYTMDLSFSKYDFQNMESRLQVIVFVKLTKNINILYIYRQNGIIRTSFKTF